MPIELGVRQGLRSDKRSDSGVIRGMNDRRIEGPLARYRAASMGLPVGFRYRVVGWMGSVRTVAKANIRETTRPSAARRSCQAFEARN